MSKEILITGAEGFIGSATYRRLELVYPLRRFTGDITKSKDWGENLQLGDTLLLFAGIRTETERDYLVNTGSITQLLETAQRIKKLPVKVILASSQAVYMGNQIPFNEDQMPIPTTLYGQSKYMAEVTARMWCEKLNIPLVILRYSTVLGPGVRTESRMSGPLAIWTHAALKGEPIKINQDGKQTRDYIHVQDVVDANLQAIENLEPGIYNVGGGTAISIIRLANWINEAAGGKSEIQISGNKPTPEDPKVMFSDITKLKASGWKPMRSIRSAVEVHVSSVI